MGAKPKHRCFDCGGITDRYDDGIGDYQCQECHEMQELTDEFSDESDEGDF